MDIEFQTGNLTEKFLLRCAQYAVNLRVISGKLVETIIMLKQVWILKLSGNFKMD